MRKRSPKLYGQKQENLTGREIEVLTWVARGKTNVEIAAILAVAEATVKTHIARAGKKLNTANKAHAVAVAITLRLIQP